jgi:hypothetical protein
MSQAHRSSIPEKEEPMDTPDPHRISSRKKFDAFEQGITGGHHIGHLPVYVHEIEGWTFRRVPVWLQPGPHAQRRHLVVENHQRGRGDQQLQVLTSSAEFQLLDASAAQATAECGYCCTRNCRNRGRTPQSSRFRHRNQCRNNRYRISTSVIGDAKRAESEEQRGAGADAAGGKTATRQAAADLRSQQHRAHNARAAKSTWSMTIA